MFRKMITDQEYNIANVQVDTNTNQIFTTLDNEIIIFDIKKGQKLFTQNYRDPIAYDIISWMKTDQIHKKIIFCDESEGLGVFNYKGCVSLLNHSTHN